jgi:riboflavin synthase
VRRSQAICIQAQETNGSWSYTFEYDESLNNFNHQRIYYSKWSKFNSGKFENQFSVAIIPYTYEHTNFKEFSVGTKVNLEFDVIGKYVSRLYSNK